MQSDNLPSPHGAASPEVFRRLGEITRLLHDSLNELGVMPKLRQAADDLPDARSRLGYVVRKSGEAADRVLNAVEQAKAEQQHVASAARELRAAVAGQDAEAVVERIAALIERSTERTNSQLTDIMMAQDFHDLTGQVVAKVVHLATELEESLVGLLVKAAPAEVADLPSSPRSLAGPVIDGGGGGNPDVANSQAEVDELLAKFGF